MASATKKYSKRHRRVSERIELRVSPEQKTHFVRAAQLRGQSLTDFAVDSMQRAAVQTAEDNHVLRLSTEDSRIFVDALMNPPKPNEAVSRAAKRYDDSVVRY